MIPAPPISSTTHSGPAKAKAPAGSPPQPDSTSPGKATSTAFSDPSTQATGDTRTAIPPGAGGARTA